MATGSADRLRPNPPIAGRYAIGDEIGRGAAATVYLGQDLETGQTVAVKVLRRELVDSTLSKRFLREIRLAAQLRHPTIVSVLDSGETDGVPYYVMPVFRDGTLAQRLQTEGPLPFDVVLRIASELGTALDFAHAYGVLHRDIKPQNVLFEGTHVLLGDFGIALALDQRETDRLTDSGVAIGTPLYMSPEQGGSDVVIDRRSDVYSMACLVFEMIAGETPFTGPTAKAVIAKHRSEPVPSLSVVRPTVPAAVQAVIETALAKVPADRYPTAGAFAHALAEAMWSSDTGLVSPRSSGSVPDTVPRGIPIRRRRWQRVPAAGVVLVVIGALLTYIQHKSSSAAGDAVLDPHRIAVLYFEDLSPGDPPSYLADGLTEALIDQLSSVPALHVISPAGVRPFKNRPIPVDSIARALGVGTIVSGSVQRSGDSVRLAVRLADAASGQQLHSETIRQPWSRLFQIQDSLTTQIAFALRQRLGRVIDLRAIQASTKSPQAWEQAQLASQTFQAAMTARRAGGDDRGADELMLGADARYAHAESLDTKWPRPTLKRAIVARIIAEWNDGLALPRDEPDLHAVPPDTGNRLGWLSRALRLADASLKKGADSSDVFEIKSQVFYRMAMIKGSDSLLRAAEAGFQRVVRAKPYSAPAWVGLADIYLRDGRFADAAEAAQQAYDADAFFEVRATISKGFLAALYSQTFDDAKKWCDAGLGRYPHDEQFSECRLRVLGWSAGRQSGDVARAWRELNDIERRDSTGTLKASWAFRRFMVAATIARAGLRDSALHVVDRIHAQQPDVTGPARGRLEEAYVRLLLGDHDTAIALLEQHLAIVPIARSLVSRHPWYAPLHGNERFEAAVRQAP